MKKNIILTGSLAYDYIFDIPDTFSKYILPDKIHKINISIVTDSHKRTFGGTAGNQAFYLGKLGLYPYIFATAGKDFSEYKFFLKKNGVDTKYIRISQKDLTASGFVMTDIKDNQIWMFSKAAMKNSSRYQLKTAVSKMKSPFIVISPNELQTIINYIGECKKLKLDYAFDPAFFIPHLPKNTLFDGVKNAKIIFGNDYEIAFIEKRLKKKIIGLVDDKQIIAKTLGDQGSEIFQNGRWTKIGIYKTKTSDPTGAGDAFRAGFLSGYLNNQPLKTCGWMGAVTASFAVEVKGTMNLKFSKKEFEKRVKYVLNTKSQ